MENRGENAAPDTWSVVRGIVRIKGTDTPASGLLARAIAQLGSESFSLGSSLVEKGAFEIRYDESRLDAFKKGRPSVRVSISGASSSKPLVESEIRPSCAPDEVFLLSIDSEALASEGMASALRIAARSTDSATAAKAVAAERDLATAREKVVVAERRRAIDQAAAKELDLDSKLRARLQTELTGIPKDSKVWKRVVPPGAVPVAIANEYQETAIREELAPRLAGGAETYLVLSEEERNALGTPPDPAKVRALLRGDAGSAEMVRLDVHRFCAEGLPNPFAPPPPDPPPPPPPPQNGTAPTGDVIVKQRLDALMASIASPEEPVVTGPDGSSAAGKVLGVSIQKGPADMPAVYDFQRLELAFDHVWEDARLDGVIEKAKVLARQIENAGGDLGRVLDREGSVMRALKREGRIIRAAGGSGVIYKDTVDHPPTNPNATHIDPDLVNEAELGEPVRANPVEPPAETPHQSEYPFTVFAPGTVNFGLLVTYQQRFAPLNYQVGRLIGTRTLAPKETYSFTTKQVVKKSFNRKQMEANQRLRRDESEDSSRDESEVARRAQNKSNFAMSTSGGFDLGPLGEGTATTNLGKDSESSSQEAKKSQRSAVRKAAQEVKSETRLELETAFSSEIETVEKREVTNPNDELALTCVFYELQRRFEVSESLSKLTPVLLVAQHVPRPEEVTEAWVRKYDWIIRRFLPDDSFEPALTYLVTSAAGDRVILEELRNHLTGLRANVTQLGKQVASALDAADKEYKLLSDYIEQRAKATAGDRADGIFDKIWGAVVQDREAAQIEKVKVLEEATKERFEKASQHERDLRARMEREVNALQLATDEYTKALATERNRQVEIDRLLEHIRQNILLYMHGIWSYEHPDQRFFRHYALTAPRLRPLLSEYSLELATTWPSGVLPVANKQAYKVTFTTSVDPAISEEEKRATLAELVDLHSWMGMFGNYFIYPLKESNALTDYMMTPYLDAEMGIRDPDVGGNFTLESFTKYVECLRKHLPPTEFAAVEGRLRTQYQELLTSPHRNSEEITVPSNGVYMQMLVDTGKLLEKYKEEHRMMDVMKVREEVRTAAIDNLRRAKLILENKLDDPNIEAVKNVYYRGPAPHDGDE